jgi:hypothetical protein
MRSDGGLRQLLRKHLPQVHWVTVESRATESGIPDVEYCFEGKSGWIECKVTRGWSVSIRPAQVAWILRRTRAGGRVFILVRQRGAERDDLWMVRGEYVRLLRDGGLAALPAAGVACRGCGGAGRWPWLAALRALGR